MLMLAQSALRAPETPTTPPRASRIANQSRTEWLPRAAIPSGPRNSTVTATPSGNRSREK